jgi:hypothetical protein
MPLPAKPALLALLPGVTRIAFTANSQALLLARPAAKSLTLYDLASRTETPPLKALAHCSALALSADSRLIAIGTSKGDLVIDSAHTGKTLWKTRLADEQDKPLPILDLAFSIDASLLFATTGNSFLHIFHASTGNPLPPAAGFDPIPSAACRHLALSPDGHFLAHAETHSNSILIWHLPSKQVAQFIRLPIPHGPIASLAFGITVRQLHIAQHRHLSTFNGETGQLTLDFPLPPTHSLAVLLDGNILATTQPATPDSPKQFLHLHSAPTGRLRRSIPLPPSLQLEPLRASPNTHLITLPTNEHAYLWQADKLV